MLQLGAVVQNQGLRPQKARRESQLPRHRLGEVERKTHKSKGRQQGWQSIQENLHAHQEKDRCAGPAGRWVESRHHIHTGKAVTGIFLAELIQAARGGNAGRRRFMEKLKRNEERPPAEDPRPAQVKKKEKDKGEATLHFI